MAFRVMYFAWMRERIGEASEVIDIKAATVQDIVDHLRTREERYQLAFEDMSAVKVAVDQVLSDYDTPLKGGEEIAFFPPMTGG
ncbi:MAG: molybdopterin converting factor subunit 1 [Pseudomonadota bacterium]